MRYNSKKIRRKTALKAVIFDWAGTTMDYGCFAPTGAFIETFNRFGLSVTQEEARGPMGKHKRDHIKEILRIPRISEQWENLYGRKFIEEDVDFIYRDFIPLQLSVLEEHSAIVPELPSALEVIRQRDMKIGSTTGYSRQMMDIIGPLAAKQGYKPDCVVCASDVRAGRPAPWMAFRNAEILGVYPARVILKIGDTITDIEEGKNAGMWSVGVVRSGNELGLSLKEVKEMEPHLLEAEMEKVRIKFLNAGADFVIDDLNEIDALIEKINELNGMAKRP
jgi:phosphonoacetaldehyde hydrolase